MSLGILLKHIRSLMSQRANCRNLAALSRENLTILTYHRILPWSKGTDRIEPGMYVTPSTLSKHIHFLKKYFKIVTIDHVEKYLTESVSKKSGKPLCLITFDDGWSDFYKYAWPILEQEEVPAIVYLPTKLIGTSNMFWTDRLALILTHGGLEVLVDVLDNSAINKNLFKWKSDQARLHIAIEYLKKYKYFKIDSILDECVEKIGQTSITERSFMNWDEIRSLYRSGLVSFGSHTANHSILTTLSHPEMVDELVSSREKLIDEKVVGEKISFCYPNGNYNSEISNLIQEVGYSSAVSCSLGWNTRKDDPFTLKRISLHQDISSTDSLLAYRLSNYL